MTNNYKNSRNLQQLANCIRFLAIDAVQQANSGHPGMPMGMADIATILFKDYLKFDPNYPQWLDRDRLVISNGHGSMLLYACLYLTGYQSITLEDIQNFRQLGSPTAGHPEYGEIDGVETTTGPLAQGLANSVGMALAEKILNSRFGNDIIDHYTYVFAGDGCLMEGLSHEACSLAGHLNLSKIIVFFDDNSISIDGPTKLSVSEDHIKRFQSYGWDAISIDGHNHNEISTAIKTAKTSQHPTLIACKTKIGFGSPNKEKTASSHGSPLGEKEVELTRKKLEWSHPPFEIPQNLINDWRKFFKRNEASKNKWEQNHEKIKHNATYKKYFDQKISSDLLEKINDFKSHHFIEKTNCASRKASELSLEIFVPYFENLIGGSADLTGSNNTKTKESKPITKDDFSGSYIHYGVREHAMTAIMSGLSLHKGLRPYGGTFLIFTDYCRPSIRLAAIMGLPIIYVMTHDSIGLGEDGPTHQPVEHLSSLRSIPNLNVIRPCDIVETIESWLCALNETNTPTILVLTRQNLALMRNIDSKNNLVQLGAYPIIDFDNYDATVLASGSEVEIAVQSSNTLLKEKINVRVISFPSWELFTKQSIEYQKKILGNQPLFGIEAGIINGWEKYLPTKNFIGMRSFGASGPYKKLYKHFGLTSENLINLIKNNI